MEPQQAIPTSLSFILRYNDKKGWKEEENNVSKSGHPDFFFIVTKIKRAALKKTIISTNYKKDVHNDDDDDNDDDDNDDDNDDKDDNNDKNDNDDGDDDDDGDDEDNDDDGKVI